MLTSLPTGKLLVVRVGGARVAIVCNLPSNCIFSSDTLYRYSLRLSDLLIPRLPLDCKIFGFVLSKRLKYKYQCTAHLTMLVKLCFVTCFAVINGPERLKLQKATNSQLVSW
jgi:hypothetical protein